MKVLIGISVACSGLAVLACLIVIPSLYNDIGSLHQEIMGDMKQFRVSMDHCYCFLLRALRGRAQRRQKKKEKRL